MLIIAEQPKTRTQEPAKPQFAEVRFGEAARRHPILNTIGAKLAPTQEAANFPTRLKCEAAALVLPYAPYPASKLTTESWTPQRTEVKRALGADFLR